MATKKKISPAVHAVKLRARRAAYQADKLAKDLPKNLQPGTPHPNSGRVFPSRKFYVSPRCRE